jgi:hypothetical protein
MARRRKQPLLPVEAIADRQSTDRLERRDGRLYLVDTKGYFAAVEVRDDETAGWPTFQANTQKMLRAEEINRVVRMVALTGALTDEGREMRLNALRARWRELFCDAMFVVDD